MARMVSSGEDHVSLQMHPSELGRVDVKLDISSDKQVKATISADNQSTLDLLKHDSDKLQQVLKDAGLQADSGSLQFSLRDQGNQQEASLRSGCFLRRQARPTLWTMARKLLLYLRAHLTKRKITSFRRGA